MTMHRGFTLIETVVAVAIFAIISLVGYSSLQTAIVFKKQQTSRAIELQEAQVALTTIDRDLSQITRNSLEITPDSFSFESVQPRGHFRVTYRLTDGIWIREEGPDRQLGTLTLLKRVDDVEINTIENNGRIQSVEIRVNHQTFGELIKQVFISG